MTAEKSRRVNRQKIRQEIEDFLSYSEKDVLETELVFGIITDRRTAESFLMNSRNQEV